MFYIKREIEKVLYWQNLNVWTVKKNILTKIKMKFNFTFQQSEDEYPCDESMRQFWKILSEIDIYNRILVGVWYDEESKLLKPQQDGRGEK